MSEDAHVHVGPDGQPRTRRYIDLAGVMFVEYDREARITMLNERGGELLGVTEAEVLGKDWFELFAPPARRAEMRARFAKIFAVEQSTGRYDGPVVSRDGREMTFSWNWSVEKDERGRR
ncbi:MAG TPA: PAS domain S-box protein, partial [bacterium]|nr:PAS domain S-box protein [bacterium]